MFLYPTAWWQRISYCPLLIDRIIVGLNGFGYEKLKIISTISQWCGESPLETNGPDSGPSVDLDVPCKGISRDKWLSWNINSPWRTLFRQSKNEISFFAKPKESILKCWWSSLVSFQKNNFRHHRFCCHRWNFLRRNHSDWWWSYCWHFRWPIRIHIIIKEFPI